MIKLRKSECTNCRLCMLACTAMHESGLHSTKFSCIRIDDVWPEIGAMHVCGACSKRSCIKACPEKALSWDKHVVLAKDNCTRCGACAEACPFGGVRFHPVTGYPLIEAIHLMGKREGPGKDWSQGVRHLEGVISGAKGRGGHAKGLELPAYDPRASKTMALASAASDRGGCHRRSWPITEEVLSANLLGQHTTEFKPEVIKGQQDFYSLINYSGFCLFAAFVFSMDQIASLIKYVIEFSSLGSAKKLIAAGERGNTLVRLFNLREGLTADQDTLPEKFRTDPFSDGPCKGETVDVASRVSAYSSLREWGADGVPPPALLKKLDLVEQALNI